MPTFRKDHELHGMWIRAMDPYNHAVTQEDVLHRLIHDGFMFTVAEERTGIANGANLDYLLRVPAGTFCHLQKFVVAASDTPIRQFLYEGPTTSDDGTELTLVNHSRVSSLTANTDLFRGPTVSDTGTLLHTASVYSQAAFGARPGVINSPAEEWVLDEGDYLLRATNNSGGSVSFTTYIAFYEPRY